MVEESSDSVFLVNSDSQTLVESISLWNRDFFSFFFLDKPVCFRLKRGREGLGKGRHETPTRHFRFSLSQPIL